MLEMTDFPMTNIQHFTLYLLFYVYETVKSNKNTIVIGQKSPNRRNY